MLRKVLEFFGFWKSAKPPEFFIGSSTCETLDSVALINVMTPRRKMRKWLP